MAPVDSRDRDRFGLEHENYDNYFRRVDLRGAFFGFLSCGMRENAQLYGRKIMKIKKNCLPMDFGVIRRKIHSLGSSQARLEVS